jgi:septum formation inhibitor MinC
MKVELKEGTQLMLGRHLVALVAAVEIEIAAQSKDEVAEILADNPANFALNRDSLEHEEEVQEGRTVKTLKVTYGLHGAREVEVTGKRELPSAEEEAAALSKAESEATEKRQAEEKRFREEIDAVNAKLEAERLEEIRARQAVAAQVEAAKAENPTTAEAAAGSPNPETDAVN